MGFDKGLDFSKIKRFSVEEGIVYKDSYYNTGNQKYKKSTTRQVHTPDTRRVLIECMKKKMEYDEVIRRLSAKYSYTIKPVKESYWDMALRAFSYLDIDNESDVEGWIESPKDIKTYMTQRSA
jgi:hypothetical protein